MPKQMQLQGPHVQPAAAHAAEGVPWGTFGEGVPTAHPHRKCPKRVSPRTCLPRGSDAEYRSPDRDELSIRGEEPYYRVDTPVAPEPP